MRAPSRSAGGSCAINCFRKLVVEIGKPHQLRDSSFWTSAYDTASVARGVNVPSSRICRAKRCSAPSMTRCVPDPRLTRFTPRRFNSGIEGVPMVARIFNGPFTALTEPSDGFGVGDAGREQAIGAGVVKGVQSLDGAVEARGFVSVLREKNIGSGIENERDAGSLRSRFHRADLVQLFRSGTSS